MIEVEKKFKLKEHQIEELLIGAEFLREVKFSDVYYDNSSFDFIKKDVWLRKRGNDYQLKTPLSFNNSRLLDQYKEIELESEIIDELKLKSNLSLKDNLLEFGLFPFCNCKTTRRKYKNGDFIIDIDEVDYGDFKYSICEIELMVLDESSVDEAILRILDFANKYNLEVAPVRGKVVEFIRFKHPDLYMELFEDVN